MFIAFNNLPHCAPTERHVYVLPKAINILLLRSKAQTTRYKHRVFYLVFVFAP
jgi:hypothetical protein